MCPGRGNTCGLGAALLGQAGYFRVRTGFKASRKENGDTHRQSPALTGQHGALAEATKRGLGAALLRSPRKLARLVAGIAAGSPLPLTVKVRTGTSASKINVAETVAALHAAGAAAVTVHGRAPPYCLFLSASLEELTGVEALPDLLCGALFTA